MILSGFKELGLFSSVVLTFCICYRLKEHPYVVVIALSQILLFCLLIFLFFFISFIMSLSLVYWILFFICLDYIYVLGSSFVLKAIDLGPGLKKTTTTIKQLFFCDSSWI